MSLAEKQKQFLLVGGAALGALMAVQYWQRSSSSTANEEQEEKTGENGENAGGCCSSSNSNSNSNTTTLASPMQPPQRSKSGRSLLGLTQHSARVVFVLGGPGAGKGTQCAKLVQEFGVVHLSAGDLLRAERNAGGENADLINSYIRDGKIVPVEITLSLLRAAMERNVANGKNTFLVDGFPRNQNNLEGWEKHMNDYAEVLFLLYLDVPEEVMEERLLSRRDQMMARGEKVRSDDNPESIKKRFRVFIESTQPIIDIFQRRGLVRRITTVSTPNEVFQKVREPFLDVGLRPVPQEVILKNDSEKDLVFLVSKDFHENKVEVGAGSSSKVWVDPGSSIEVSLQGDEQPARKFNGAGVLTVGADGKFLAESE